MLEKQQEEEAKRKRAQANEPEPEEEVDPKKKKVTRNMYGEPSADTSVGTAAEFKRAGQ